MKLEEITNKTIYTIDWAREDRQRMLKRLSAAEPFPDKAGRSQGRVKRLPAWRARMQSAVASICNKMRLAFAIRRHRYLDLCEEIQRHGYLAGWRRTSTWSRHSDQRQTHKQMEG